MKKWKFKKKFRNNNGIKWDFETEEENGIKCRVDHDNQVNVFLQQSFLLKFVEALNVIFECTNLFYQNNYPIIGIENQNGGGVINIAQFFHQLLQVKTIDRMHFSGRKTDLYRQVFENMLR